MDDVLLGTYLKTWAPPSFGTLKDPGLEISLCLFGEGYFAYIGHWRKYELTTAFGTWRQDGLIVNLDGVGEIHLADFEPRQHGRRLFQRSFTRFTEGEDSYLLALDEPREWSLLSWRGPYAYRGARLEMNLAQTGLPTTWDDLGRLTRSMIESR